MSRLLPILHIGLHKTGTTFLQTAYFPRLKGVRYAIGWRGLRYIVDCGPEDRHIISDEGFSGRIFSGEWEADFYRNLTILKNLFGEVKILVGFREPEKFILSVYKQWLQEGGIESVDHVFNREGTGLIKVEELLFQRRLETLRSQFPEVFVYTQGELRHRFPDFVKAFAQFAGIEAQDPSIFTTTTPNIGVNSNQQIRRLIALNKFNRNLRKLPGKPNLYGRIFEKTRLTPRWITQARMKDNKNDPFQLDPELTAFIQDFCRDDWEYIRKQVSF